MLHTMKNIETPIPDEPVAFREGTIVDPSMANAFASEGYKVICHFTDQMLEGSEIQTFLNIEAWVRNVDFVKNVYVDTHIFDESGGVVFRDTKPLGYSQTAGGGGDFFQIDSMVYRGSGGLANSVWPRTDARMIQYRLYYEVLGKRYSDGIVHQHLLPKDVALEFAAAKAA